MGAACCTAAKDRTILNEPRAEMLQRHVRHSPSWSFRWDNRVRVAGEETTANWLRDESGGNSRGDAKSGTTVKTGFPSEGSCQIDSSRSLSGGHKSPVFEGNADQVISPNLAEAKESSTGAPSVSHPSPVKLSPPAPSVSSVSTSSLSSQSQLLTRQRHYSAAHLLLYHPSDSGIPGHKSPTVSISEEPSLFVPPASANESTRGSNGGSSDSWSIPALSELMTTRRERWSFDSEHSGFSREKVTGSSGQSSRSPSVDLQTCGVCAKLLTERSSWLWSSQKIISTNELAVVSVLTCGHVYHAECLEYMTPEINKYDPLCPVCNFGEKRVVKMSEKALKAELDLKARKKSRKRVVDSALNSDIIMLDNQKHNGVEERSPKMSSSTSMKSSLGKPFLKRHFSFSSKSGRSSSENQSTRRKGFLWGRSSKE